MAVTAIAMVAAMKDAVIVVHAAKDVPKGAATDVAAAVDVVAAVASAREPVPVNAWMPKAEAKN